MIVAALLMCGVMVVGLFITSGGSAPLTRADELSAVQQTVAFLNTLKPPASNTVGQSEVTEATAFVDMQFGAAPLEKLADVTSAGGLSKGYNIVVDRSLYACVSFSVTSTKWESHSGACRV
jgi:hypothetical protein